MNNVTANLMPFAAALFLQTLCIFAYSWSADDHHRLKTGIWLITCFGLVPGVLFAAYALYYGAVIGPLKEGLAFTSAGLLLSVGTGDLVRRLRNKKNVT